MTIFNLTLTLAARYHHINIMNYALTSATVIIYCVYTRSVVILLWSSVDKSDKKQIQKRHGTAPQAVLQPSKRFLLFV